MLDNVKESEQFSFLLFLVIYNLYLAGIMSFHLVLHLQRLVAKFFMCEGSEQKATSCNSGFLCVG